MQLSSGYTWLRFCPVIHYCPLTLVLAGLLMAKVVVVELLVPTCIVRHKLDLDDYSSSR